MKNLLMYVLLKPAYDLFENVEKAQSKSLRKSARIDAQLALMGIGWIGFGMLHLLLSLLGDAYQGEVKGMFSVGFYAAFLYLAMVVLSQWHKTRNSDPTVASLAYFSAGLAFGCMLVGLWFGLMMGVLMAIASYLFKVKTSFITGAVMMYWLIIAVSGMFDAEFVGSEFSILGVLGWVFNLFYIENTRTYFYGFQVILLPLAGVFYAMKGMDLTFKRRRNSEVLKDKAKHHHSLVEGSKEEQQEIMDRKVQHTPESEIKEVNMKELLHELYQRQSNGKKESLNEIKKENKNGTLPSKNFFQPVSGRGWERIAEKIIRHLSK